MSVSEKDSKLTLEYLSFSKEDQYLERKSITESGLKPSKLADEIIWMLNADGWVIALWITDDWVFQDIKTLPTEKINSYRATCFDFIEPSANVCLEEVLLSTWELIFLYHIEQDYERVFRRKQNENTFLRIWDSNRWPLSREEERKLEYDKNIRKFEDETREDFEPQDLRKQVLDFYAEKIKFKGTHEELLLSRHLAVKKSGNIFYKNAAILLFSEDPEKYIPSSSIRYIRYSWISIQTWTLLNVIKDEYFTWCIPRLIEIIKRFLRVSMKDYYFLNIQEGRFMKVSEYPEEAWLEGIVNALCHRSYNIQGNVVYIKHFDDRLEISNSWPLPAQVTVDTIRESRFSRNPRIARVLSDLWYVRELNEWTSRIFEAMQKSMLPVPEYTDKNNIVTLVLRNKVANHDATISEKTMNNVERKWGNFSPTEIEIIQYLFEHHTANIDELDTNIKKTETAIRSALNKLLESDILVKETNKIRDRNAMYLFKKS